MILGLIEDTLVATPWTQMSVCRVEELRVRGVDGVAEMGPSIATLILTSEEELGYQDTMYFQNN